MNFRLPNHPQRGRLGTADLVRDFTRISHRSGVAGRVGRALLGCGWRLFRGREQGKTKSQFGSLQRRIERLLMQQQQANRAPAAHENLGPACAPSVARYASCLCWRV